MIIGIGTDLCQIARMEVLLVDDKFLSRYFDPREQVYIKGRGLSAAQTMAGIFAAKEAFAKALGRGFFGIPPKDIIVCQDEAGAPYLELGPGAQSAADKKGVVNMHLSISHEGGLALAFCVLEGA